MHQLNAIAMEMLAESPAHRPTPEGVMTKYPTLFNILGSEVKRLPLVECRLLQVEEVALLRKCLSS